MGGFINKQNLSENTSFTIITIIIVLTKYTDHLKSKYIDHFKSNYTDHLKKTIIFISLPGHVSKLLFQFVLRGKLVLIVSIELLETYSTVQRSQATIRFVVLVIL